MNPYHYTKVDQPVLPPVLVPKNCPPYSATSLPELPSLDEPVSGVVAGQESTVSVVSSDTTSSGPVSPVFPMTESPPPGYITDDGDGVSSPGSNISSNGQ